MCASPCQSAPLSCQCAVREACILRILFCCVGPVCCEREFPSLNSLLLGFILFFRLRSDRGGGGRALTMGDYESKVRGRLLAAWVVWGARLRRGPGAPLSRRGVGPTLTYRGEARTTAQFINSTHLLVPSPVQRRSGRLPPRPPGPLRVLESCLSTASAMAAPLWGVA